MAVTSQPSDLPITKWLQESIHQFWKLDEEIELSARPHLHHHRPRAEEPQTKHWERAFQIFDLLQ
jgi:hypothetical protein